MNDSDELLPDELIEKALASFRSVTPPKELHEASLTAVHQAIACRTKPVWWRRSVAVPIPFAIAASVAFVLTSTALLSPWVMPKEIQQVAPQPIQTELSVDNPEHNLIFEAKAAPTWSVTRSYIHSLESLSNSQIIWTPDTEEKRDDS